MYVEKNQKVSIVEAIFFCNKKKLMKMKRETSFLFKAKYDAVLKEQLDHDAPKLKCLSHKIQNELIGNCGQFILVEIMFACYQPGLVPVFKENYINTIRHIALIWQLFMRQRRILQKHYGRSKYMYLVIRIQNKHHLLNKDYI